jgi:hypothetical protein
MGTRGPLACSSVRGSQSHGGGGFPQRRRSDLPGSPGHLAAPLLTHPTMTPHDLGLLVVLLLPGMLLSVLLLSTFAAGG